MSTESPLPPAVQRCLGDRSYEKRKNAALEIEALIRSLQEASNQPMIRSIIAVLSKDFCTSMNANYRKGGLIGIAAVAIGLMMEAAPMYLTDLLPPVLQCFDDPESRVRYYACESLYNISKIVRVSILNRYFTPIFEGLCKLYADPDVDVKNGAGLLDRLVKDIVTESESFNVDTFIPLLQTYIRRTNPYIRQLLIGWITILDSVPDINMIDYLPDFLEGLFNMLSDSNREIRQAADSALSEFLREVRESAVVEFGPIISILVSQCHSKDRLNRLTAISWLTELIHHPYSGGDALLPFHAEILGAAMRCLSDTEVEIRQVAERTNMNLLDLIHKTSTTFQISPLLETLKVELSEKNDVPTQIAALRWINMLYEKQPQAMNSYIDSLLSVLLRTLSDPSDDVVLLNLQVLSRIALAKNCFTIDPPSKTNDAIDSDPTSNDDDDNDETNLKMKKQDALNRRGKHRAKADKLALEFSNRKKATDLLTKQKKQFQKVINAILSLFADDSALLEVRGALIIRKLCVLLDAENVYITMANSLVANEKVRSTKNAGTQLSKGSFSIGFIGKMVQTLNLILLSAVELHGLRVALANTFSEEHNQYPNGHDYVSRYKKVFPALFHCWCHNPVSTFSLCLLAKAYNVAYALIRKFSEFDVTVGFLMQIDKLVQLLESPVFINLRIQLLDVDTPHHDDLLKSCYGLLMLLPQSDAFRILNNRLATVCHLRDNLGLPSLESESSGTSSESDAIISTEKLLKRFDEVVLMHSKFSNDEGITETMLMTKMYTNGDFTHNANGSETQTMGSSVHSSQSYLSSSKSGLQNDDRFVNMNRAGHVSNPGNPTTNTAAYR